jgi:flavin reductase (DIM6/NTAB) family NADH-FMN oxidoreductase RutF
VELAVRRKTLRLISNGMYIMTARDGAAYGAATVTWISQASFKPPLVMAAVRAESNVFRCLSVSGRAAIHILGSDQREVAQRFFFPTKATDGLLNGEPFSDGRTGAPVLENLPAYFECNVVKVIRDIGDHAIVLLEVVEAECRAAVRPLTIAESPWEYGG